MMFCICIFECCQLVAQLFQSQQVVMSDLQTYIDMFGLGVNANTTLDIIQEPPFRGVSGGEAMLDVGGDDKFVFVAVVVFLFGC